MLLVKKDNIKFFISKNILNILFLSILFSANKHFIFTINYVRGVLIDYSLIKFSILHFIFILLLIFFFPEIKNNKKSILIISLIFIVNLCFSVSPIFSIVYFLNFLPLLLVLILFINTHLSISYKLVCFVNIFYLFVFIIQFITKQNVFPYAPLGFYPYNGVGANLDFFSYFGEKYVLPIGNFPHSNVFAAFISFLNIFHFKNKNYLFILLNIFIILILSSLSSIIFTILLTLFFTKDRLTKWLFLLFIPIIYLFYLYGFKDVSVYERFNQLKVFIYFTQNYLLFGVGANSFIPLINLYESVDKRIYILQPIHNIFLLFISEFGLFTSVFLLFLINKYRSFLKPSPYLLFILVFGMFDHFLLTLYSGLILLSLTIILHISIIINSRHV